MPKQVAHDEIRKALIQATVRAGARSGLAGITNHAIAELSGQKEAILYRYFVDRDDLIQKAFFSCDRNFFQEMKKNAAFFKDTRFSCAQNLRRFFDACWDYSARDLNYCVFYVRYYYSIFNTPELRQKHREICLDFYESIKEYLPEDFDADMAMHHIFSLVLTVIMDVSLNIVPDTPESRDRIFFFFKSILLSYHVSIDENVKES